MNIKIKFKNKKITLKEIIIAWNYLKIRGLMFRKKEKAPILLFEMQKPASIHSFFVFFPFIVLWLNNKNKVVDYRIIRPFSPYINTTHKFSKIIEIPISRRYYDRVNFLVGERFKKSK